MRRTLAILAIAAPFVAAIIAAASARHDLRLGAMAVIATLTVWLVPRSLASSIIVCTAATLTAAAAAIALGARNVLGLLMVAIVVAAFATAGRLLLRTDIR